MAKALGLNPKKFGGYANHQQEQWKSPLRDNIEELYEKRFGPYVDENQTESTSAKPLECAKDGFPVISINGKRECIAEYIDRCIGTQTIIDVVVHDSVIYYQFENGHELPLLCYCCGKPSQAKDITAHKDEMVGLYLHNMSRTTVILDDDQEVIDFELFFRPPPNVDKRAMKQSFWFEVAKSMKHPPGCQQGRKRLPALR